MLSQNYILKDNMIMNNSILVFYILHMYILCLICVSLCNDEVKADTVLFGIPVSLSGCSKHNDCH